MKAWLHVIAASVALLAAAPARAEAPRPHVVFLLADDLGWKNVGYHDGEAKTPNIALSRQCSVSRYRAK